ncbi:serine/threonine-protein phosphatase 2A regulatory subunit B'' subunit gamma-like [Tropilaelaps mercedesae]|uniref:Serine/threonine-protein phosphatase 2A regulatory subunit B'' subunit gamma-like n=1 Tax=Tropilaelaps mercedesae TaxID=418985 RepID=A0A1V9Y1Y4_9ACAR|nr:serine/threonine-protein phosphatase 2A regulatory subunit B'' subunit gamma-like [Tropilaelaps mercedesae]
MPSKVQQPSPTTNPIVSLKDPNIPTFHWQVPAQDDNIGSLLRDEARTLLLERKNDGIPDAEGVEEMWRLLEDHAVDENLAIDYRGFKKVRQLLGPMYQQFFSATVFFKLLQDHPLGYMSIRNFYNYVNRRRWLLQTRVGLALYDANGLGYLSEADLENYINGLIPTLNQLKGLEPSFHSFYCCTAVRKFIFFLDPYRTDRVRIDEIILSSFLDDLLELREDLSRAALEANWFSAVSARKVYSRFMDLDTDKNGMLSRQEMYDYGEGTFTRTFIDRVFQECITYQGEMDYKTFLDLVLALENRSQPAAIHFFFKIFDIDHKGYLENFTMRFFLRAILEVVHDPVLKVEDILDEIHDIVKPATPGRITLKDLLRCGQGGLVVSMMVDVNGFMRYDDRQFEPDDHEQPDLSESQVSMSEAQQSKASLQKRDNPSAEDQNGDMNTVLAGGSDQPRSI